MNKVWKVLLPIVLVMALLTASLPAFAAVSPTTKAIGRVTVSSRTYNGEKQEPTVRVYDTTGKRVPSQYYTVRVAGYPKNAGTYRVTVTALAPYTGKKTVVYVIKRASNSFKIEVGRTTFRRNKYRSQTTSIKVTGVKENAKVSSWSTSNRNVYVKGGKIIVRKGYYGTASLSVMVYPTANYKAVRKTIKITVKK